MQVRLRPQLRALRSDEALLDEADARRRHRAIRLSPIGGASARHLIDHVDGVAAAQEELRPALATVGRAGEIGSGLAPAVDHHDRVGMIELLRDLELHVHLPDHRRALDRAVDPAAYEEITLLGDDERTVGCGLGGRRGVDRNCAHDGNGRGDNEHDVVLTEHGPVSLRRRSYTSYRGRPTGCGLSRAASSTIPPPFQGEVSVGQANTE